MSTQLRANIVIYTNICMYIAFYFMSSLLWQWTILMNNDELTALTTHPHHVLSTPPLLLVGVGSKDEEMTASGLYISWPGPLDNHSTTNLHEGRVNLARGPRRVSPDARERRRPIVHRVKNIVQRERQPCSEGHRKDLCGALGLVSTSWVARVPQWRDEHVLQGDLRPREPLD